MKSSLKMAVSLLLIVIGITVLYVGGNILYGSLTNYEPESVEAVEIHHPQKLQPETSEFSFFIWNLGYAGLGAQEDFFFDGGKMVRPSKARAEENLQGILSAISKYSDTDFILLQEVDKHSKRSYFTNQLEAIANLLPRHAYSYAINYLVRYIPAPLHRPWDALGKVDAGLTTYSKYQPVEATRIAFPGEFPFPKRLFWLDRCMLLFRYDLPSGKQLVVINTHNEAYDEGGVIKKQEMELMKELLLKEYEQGNYIIVGGDWNQCPPGFAYDSFISDDDSSWVPINISPDFFPEGWRWVYDPKIPTNRKLKSTYERGKTFTTLIDFYLVSPNVNVLSVKGVDLNFQHSDHQPVVMKVALE